MSDEFEQGGEEIKPNKVAFSKVGDNVIGFYYGFKSVPGEKGPINLYEIKGIAGEYHFAESTADENGNKVVKVDENATSVNPEETYLIFGGKDVIDDGFKKVKIGQKCGIKFKGVQPSKKSGNSPFKLFAFKAWPDMDPDFAGFEDVTGEH